LALAAGAAAIAAKGLTGAVADNGSAAAVWSAVRVIDATVVVASVAASEGAGAGCTGAGAACGGMDWGVACTDAAWVDRACGGAG
jgi:hypothetical protein